LNSQARLAQTTLRITDYEPRSPLATGNEKSGKMARKTKRTDGMINTFKRKRALTLLDNETEN
jgi:hypothetical protein